MAWVSKRSTGNTQARGKFTRRTTGSTRKWQQRGTGRSISRRSFPAKRYQPDGGSLQQNVVQETGQGAQIREKPRVPNQHVGLERQRGLARGCGEDGVQLDQHGRPANVGHYDGEVEITSTGQLHSGGNGREHGETRSAMKMYFLSAETKITVTNWANLGTTVHIYEIHPKKLTTTTRSI